MRKRRTTARRRVSLIFFAVLLSCSSVPVYGQEETAAMQEGPSREEDGGEGSAVYPTNSEGESGPEGPAAGCSGEVPEDSSEEPREEPSAGFPEETREESGEEPSTGSPEETSEETPEETEEVSLEAYQESGEAQETAYRVMYQAHAQSHGWMGWTSEGEWAGTRGKRKRLEALNIKIVKESDDPGGPGELVQGAVTYRTHCQTYGWQEPVSDGEIAGTVNQSKRLEAIEISLTGALADGYDIYYQVHSAGFGDLGWAKNGERAGSEGYAKSIESIRILLVKKGSQDAPVQSGRSFLSPTRKGTVTYTSHVQTYGWLDPVADGAVSGTQGQAKRMEAFRIYLENPRDENGQEIAGSLTYQAHAQSYGWMDWQQDGSIAGSTGKGKRLEAVKICLTGELAEKYDVWYRVHCAAWGSLGWAKNGETAGTVGYHKEVESLEIRILPKGSGGYPQDRPASLEKEKIGALAVSANVSGQDEALYAGNGGIVGNAGKGKPLEAVRMQIEAGDGSYEGAGWSSEVTDGSCSGRPGSGKGLEAVEIRLTGELAAYNDVYYRVSVPELGWLGWAKNGQRAGTLDAGTFIEALQVMIQPRTAPAPGSGAGYFLVPLGEFKVTGYCGGVCCNGRWGGTTASGTVPAEGRTIAVAPSLIPYGTSVRIEGMDSVFIAEDTGGFANRNPRQIDVFYADHGRALQSGVSYREIWVQK